MNTNTCPHEQEIVIKKHLNYFCVYENQFTQEMFEDFRNRVMNFTNFTKSRIYTNDLEKVQKSRPDLLPPEDTNRFFDNIKDNDTLTPSSNKRLMRALVGANRFRADFASSINILNHLYLLKTLIGHVSQSSDHFLTLKLIEQYTLSIGALVLIFIRFTNTLIEFCQTTNLYERQKKIQHYQYTLMMDLFMFMANLVNLMLILFKKNQFLPLIAIISYIFEMVMGYLRYHEIYKAYDKQFQTLSESLGDAFSREYAINETYDQKIAYLQRLLESTENGAGKGIYLSLILLEQKTELEAKKNAYNLLICSMVLIIFVIFEQLIFKHLLIQQVSSKTAILTTLIVVYCCYLLKGLVVEVGVPHSLAKEVKLGDKHLLHGQIKQGPSAQTNLCMFSVVFRCVLPLLSIALLSVCSLEITVCVMFALSVFQGFIGEAIKDKQELLGESSDELLEENIGEELVSHHDNANFELP